jgi:hypothetical protein
MNFLNIAHDKAICSCPHCQSLRARLEKQITQNTLRQGNRKTIRRLEDRYWLFTEGFLALVDNDKDRRNISAILELL